ncbi:MaoC/PaaZ C-terminal domain-containing protein [Streptomyces sp. NBC_01363]|nr:MaoC/PaaZ C-terminal domain-containing protein [Streptomyces sp. NBC_01363]
MQTPAPREERREAGRHAADRERQPGDPRAERARPRALRLEGDHQELIDAYAHVSGDHQWIHTDVERAASGPYGRTIAHGYMVLSRGVPMSAELLRVEGVGRALDYGVDRVRHPAPVPDAAARRPATRGARRVMWSAR